MRAPIMTVNDGDVLQKYEFKSSNGFSTLNRWGIDASKAVAVMLLNDVIRLHQTDLGGTCLVVSCKDVFIIGKTESVSINISDVEYLYEFWRRIPDYGIPLWFVANYRRQINPKLQSEIEKAGPDVGQFIKLGLIGIVDLFRKQDEQD